MTAASRLAGERTPAIAWLVWGLAAVFFAYAFFQRVAPSVMVDSLMRDFAVGGGVLGNLSAFYFYAYASLQLPVGLLTDRWGPRRVLALAALLCGLGSLAFAFAGAVEVAYLGRLLIGAGAAFPFVGSLALATAWFPLRRFALVSGLTMLAGMGGAVLGQAPLAVLVEVLGWRPTLAGAALAAFALAAAIWLLVRDRPDSTESTAHAGAPHSAGLLVGLRDILGRAHTWLIAVYAGTMAGPMLAFGALWGVPYLMQTHQLARPFAALTVSAMLVGWGTGAPLAGWLSDHFGRRKPPLIAGAALALLSMLAVLYLPGLGTPTVAVLLFLHGAAASAMTVSFAVARELNPGQSAATAYAFVNTVNMASGALLQPLIGYLLDSRWDGTLEAGARVYSQAAYGAAFAILPGVLFAGLILAFMIPETRARTVG